VAKNEGSVWFPRSKLKSCTHWPLGVHFHDAEKEKIAALKNSLLKKVEGDYVEKST
jgi:hypothetical protein